MSSMAWIVNDEILRATTWTLVHFLWQGTALAVALAVATRAFRPSASARYAAGIVTLAAMLAAPIVTMSMIAPAAASQTAAPIAAPSAEPASPSTFPAVAPSSFVSTEPVEAANPLWFALVPALWMVGVMFFALRLVGGWMLTRRLAIEGVRPVDASVEALARDVADRLGLRRVVRVVESTRVNVPAMFGWLRPVVLLPAATMAGLTPLQLEALIAHELVHIRRHDYLVNLLQMAVETVLFFHPAVWWVSRYIRREREYCCDDAVVAVCDRVEYARALTHLATTGQMHVALAASDGSLLRRVQRLLTEPEHAAPAWMPILVVLMMAGGLAPLGLTTIGAEATAEATVDVASPRLSAREDSQAVAALTAPARTTPQPVPVRTAPQDLNEIELPTRVAPVIVEGSQQDVEAMRLRLAEAERSLELFRQEIADLEAQRETVKLEANVAASREALTAARDREERMRKAVEVGQLDAAMAAQARASVSVAERELRIAESELEFRNRSVQLSQGQARSEREYQRLREEYERLQAARAREILQKMQAESRDTPEVVHAERVEVPHVAQSPAAIEPHSGPIAAGDFINVVIDGEADFPREYRVSEAGAIRLPLLGAFRVGGRTASNVAADIRAALARGGLKRDAVVRVDVIRVRPHTGTGTH